jgi:UDP-3-O-[3-hydroxymyristoyl] glucosamine N-acyltransferase
MPCTRIADIEVISKHTSAEFIEVDLHADEKELVLELAGFLVVDEVTQADLKNGRKKWIRFRPYVVSQIIGELSYHCNRSKSAAKSELLDALSSHFENALLPFRR